MDDTLSQQNTGSLETMAGENKVFREVKALNKGKYNKLYKDQKKPKHARRH
ncbi:unnamed protein product [Brassica rapa subsp. trilocularis]